MIIKIAFKNIWRNPRRTVAIFITLALGTGSLFLYHGFNSGLMNQYKENVIRCRYGHGQLNTQGYRDKVYERPWEHWIENYEQVKTHLSGDKRVKHIFPRVQFYALLTNGKINVSGIGQGIDAKEEAKFFTALNVEEGKVLDNEEDGIVLGKGLARALNLKIGDTVTALANTVYGSLNGADLIVTGIFHTGTKEFDDTVFRIQMSQARNLLDTTKVESVAIGLHKDEDWEGVASSVKDRFENMESTPFNILDKVYYQNSVDFLAVQFDAIKMIILIIVILGIFNTVSTAVLERKQEIGNLRANGESVMDIMKLLATEGVIVGTIGSMLGILFALIINNTVLIDGILMPPAPGITRQFQVLIELQPMYSVNVFVLGLCSSLFATFFAGYRVARKQIGELLRSV